MSFKEHILKKIKEKINDKKRILFIDGNDDRAIKAALMHQKDGYLTPIILVEEVGEIKNQNLEIISMEDHKENIKKWSNEYFEMRKGKESLEECVKSMNTKEYFAMMLLKKGLVDGIIGGLIAPTAQILRPAFKIIKPQKGIKNLSSIMVMERGHEWYIFTDISVIIDPTLDQVVEIAINASNFAKQIDFKTKVAFLSFSTLGSAIHPRSIQTREATLQFNKIYKPEYAAIGEIQFDAALIPEVRKNKYKDVSFEKNPTVFVFPSLEAANIGYKISQRMGNFGAYGPIIVGLGLPVNDLSRGATVEDVYMTALLTVLQTQKV